MNSKDFIYYVTKKNGMCDIMEGNPRDQYIVNHVSIYSIKAEKCLAFSVEEGDKFYFMDESHVVYKMTRNERVEPGVIILRLKKEVAELKAELAMAKGGE
jgi:hypothetical protein